MELESCMEEVYHESVKKHTTSFIRCTYATTYGIRQSGFLNVIGEAKCIGKY